MIPLVKTPEDKSKVIKTIQSHYQRLWGYGPRPRIYDLKVEPKFYIPSTINIWKKGAHQSHLGRQRMGWFLAD